MKENVEFFFFFFGIRNAYIIIIFVFSEIVIVLELQREDLNFFIKIYLKNFQ